MKNFGDKLKEIRNSKGLPQKVVADYLELGRPNYSKIENNSQNMTVKQLRAFCELCNVSADYLLDIEVDNKVTMSKSKIDELVVRLDYIKDTIKR